MIVRFGKDRSGGWSIWSLRSWLIVGIWMFLILILWEVSREHSVLSFHLAEAIQRKEIALSVNETIASGQGLRAF